jgi:hypothetical protein
MSVLKQIKPEAHGEMGMLTSICVQNIPPKLIILTTSNPQDLAMTSIQLQHPILRIWHSGHDCIVFSFIASVASPATSRQ